MGSKIVVVTDDYFPNKLVVIADSPVEVMFLEEQPEAIRELSSVPIVAYKSSIYEVVPAAINYNPDSVNGIYEGYAKQNLISRLSELDKQIVDTQSLITKAQEDLETMMMERKGVLNV